MLGAGLCSHGSGLGGGGLRPVDCRVQAMFGLWRPCADPFASRTVLPPGFRGLLG